MHSEFKYSPVTAWTPGTLTISLELLLELGKIALACYGTSSQVYRSSALAFFSWYACSLTTNGPLFEAQQRGGLASTGSGVPK